jgi:hypothetical protein
MKRPLSAPIRSSLAICLMALGASALVGGCATQPKEPESMRDPQADFSSYKTFGWYREAQPDATGEPVSIVDTNIRAAIKNEMTRKGYQEASAGTAPDLLVDYETARAETIKSNPVRIGVGVGSWGGSGGGGVGVSSAGARNVSEGTLVVHVIDAKRKAEVWQGRAQREIKKANADPALIQAAVADTLRDFPALGAAQP